jgi:hypothetical protein
MSRLPLREAFDLRYHVPRSQAWEGSRGRQAGRVHMHVKAGEAFEAGRIRRVEGQALCGRRGRYERAPEDGEQPCPRCAEIGTRSDGRLTGLVNEEYAELAARRLQQLSLLAEEAV